MTRTFKVQPFELSPEQKEERIAEARAYRLARRESEEERHWEEGTGPASDGRVLDAVGNWGDQRAMGDDGILDRTARRFFEDPDANMGALIAGAGERMKRGDTAPVQPGPEPMDTPPIQLRMPK
ncbi:MAG TPA: hypothetical protein VFW77_00115 [Candidatus Saccharimonadales bacterium]|nr:hypothetical protein [Candidatus Saccharimonadales bacterium]